MTFQLTIGHGHTQFLKWYPNHNQQFNI